VSALFTAVSAQSVSCRYGFGYEVSNSVHWGKDKPVITSVVPGSPAEKAGIKPYDVILEVEGQAVTDSVLDDIHLFLNPPGKEIVELTIKNFAHGSRKVQVKKECVNANSLSENQLATAFGMYAVEYTCERLFSCPFVTSQSNDTVDFSQFKSFDFMGVGENQPELARKIDESIKKELLARGLKHETSKPDLMIQIYYSFNKNPNYKPPKTNRKTHAAAADTATWFNRYDITRDRMLRLPFLPPGTIETEAEYLLKLGMRFEDRKLKKGRIVWECGTDELMNVPYSVEEFAYVHIPLMLMQFPYVKYGRNVQFRLQKKQYNYTGLNYSIDNIREIATVAPFSPAAKAGLRAGDLLDFIENRRMDRTSQQFTYAYRSFLAKTIKLRDKSSRFTDANGFPDCMDWDRSKYEQVARAFADKKNLTAFAYLYYFAPFINPLGNNSLSFKISREKEKLEFVLRPEIRSEVTLMVD
jgi:hypothetical protein